MTQNYVFKPKALFVYLLLICCVAIIFFHNFNHRAKTKSLDNFADRIVIGTVSCHGPNTTQSNEETAVMIKSVLISAQLYRITIIDFHIFLEYFEDASYFSSKLEEYGCIKDICNGVQVKITFYSAINSTLIPEKYHEQMIYHESLRCGFVRMFFTSALQDVESIIYFDTDIIVTGSIRKLWENFGEMGGIQLVGIPRDMEGDNPNFIEEYNGSFNDIPHVPPKGVNTGILLMNLTKMWEFGWEEKLLRLYDDYSRLQKLTVQKLINILLYYNPGVLKILTCEYHIFSKNCDMGLYCNYLEESQYGIHVIHGAGNNFVVNKSLYDIFDSYRSFDLMHGNFGIDLATSIRNIYASPQKPNVRQSQCYGILNKYLFNNFFDDHGKLIS